MPFEPEEKPLQDNELEMVIAVIRRGLRDGAKIAEMEMKLGRIVAVAQEAGRRLNAAERIGQEVCRKFDRTLGNPKRFTELEATELMRWIKQKSNELKETLE